MICRQRGRVLKRSGYDQHGIGSKPTRVILLCPWERDATALFPCLIVWQAILSYSHISIKLQADSNILASPDAGWGNCLPFPESQEDKSRDKINIKINFWATTKNYLGKTDCFVHQT